VLEEWLEFTRLLLSPYGFQRNAIGMWIKDGPGQGDLETWGMGCEFILYYKRGRRTRGGKRTNLIFTESPGPAQQADSPAREAHGSASASSWIIRPGLATWWSILRRLRQPGSRGRECDRSGISIEADEMNYQLAKQSLDEMEKALF